MEDNLKKKKWKTTSILKQSYPAYLTTKTLKTNGFDTIEIDLVCPPSLEKKAFLNLLK